MTTKATCPDCGAFCERWGDHWRCPWSKATPAMIRAQSGHEFVFNCGRPYAGDRSDIMAPIQGRVAR